MSENKSIFKKEKGISRKLVDELFGPFEEFRPAQQYQGYDMFFLKKPIVYKFTEPIRLSKTKYSYLAKKIAKADLINLNCIFARMVVNLKIGEGAQFINGKTVKFYHEKNPGETCEYEDDLLWMVTLSIQGYKKGDANHPTPIWKIDEARLTFW